MGLTVSVQAICPIRAVEFMTLAGDKTEGDQYGKQCETFHRAPLSHLPVIGNPVSPLAETFPGRIILDAIGRDPAMIQRHC